MTRTPARSESQVRRRRSDYGSIKVSERDIELLYLVGEQYAVTVPQLARLIGRSFHTARALRDRWKRAGWIDSGQLPAHRIGKRSIRIRREDLAAVIRPARDQTMKEVKEQDLQITHLGRRPVDVENLIGSLREGQERILARRKGKRFRSSVSLIREGRDERSAAL